MPKRERKCRRWIAPLFIALGLLVAGYFAFPVVSDWLRTRQGPATSEMEPSTEPLAADEVPASGGPGPSATPIPAGTGSRIGEIAPEFTLMSLSGEPVSLSQFRGRVVILDFWASWCTPCRATMPSLHALWRDVAARGVVLVGVSLDRTDAAASSYLAANGFDDMIGLWGSLAAAQAVATRYNVRAIPRTVVIDRSGVVRFNNHSALLDLALLESVL